MSYAGDWHFKHLHIIIIITRTTTHKIRIFSTSLYTANIMQLELATGRPMMIAVSDICRTMVNWNNLEERPVPMLCPSMSWPSSPCMNYLVENITGISKHFKISYI